MTDLLEKCETCQAILDEEDMFCGNCGREAPDREQAEQATATRTSTHNFQCRGCGASMSYDAKAQTLHCPFCGSERLEKQKDEKVLAPEWIVPFDVEHEGAVAAMRRALGSGFWRPSDLAEKAVITKIKAVYVPYWVFSAKTHTFWTADTNKTPRGASGDWYPMTGEHHGDYSGVLIGASGSLTPGETSSICPYDLARYQTPEQINTDDVVIEQFRVQRKYARPLARQALEQLETAACDEYVPGKSRNVHVNVRLEGLSSTPVLLPVWIMAYQYKERVYRFLANGQTGRTTGQAPFSWKKLFVVLGIAILILLGILIAFGAMNGLASDFDSIRPSNRNTTVAQLIPMRVACQNAVSATRDFAIKTQTNGIHVPGFG